MTTNVLLANATATFAMATLFVSWAKGRMQTGTIVERPRRFPVPDNERFA